MTQTSVPRNSPRTWTRTARALHWGTALAVLVEVPAGLAMAWTYVDGTSGRPLAWLHLRASQVHHTLGLLLLGSVVFRRWWRWRHPVPALPPETSRGERIAVRSVQALLYGLLLLLPLSGWAALSALGAGAGYPAPELWLFTHNGFGPGGVIPHLVTPRPWNAAGWIAYGTFAKAHVVMLWLGGAVLSLHITGALKHHLINRDRVLVQMAGWRSKS